MITKITDFDTRGSDIVGDGLATLCREIYTHWLVRICVEFKEDGQCIVLLANSYNITEHTKRGIATEVLGFVAGWKAHYEALERRAIEIYGGG